MSNTTNLAVLGPVHAKFGSRIDQGDLITSLQITRLSEAALVLRDEQGEVYARLVGLESAISQATSDLLAYQCRLNTLQADLMGGPQLPIPLNQDQDLRLPPPSAAHAAFPSADVLGTSLVAYTVPSQELP